MAFTSTITLLIVIVILIAAVLVAVRWYWVRRVRAQVQLVPGQQPHQPERDTRREAAQISPISVPSPPPDLVASVRSGESVVVLGSGMNAQAGLPSWSSLLNLIIHDALDAKQVVAFEQLFQTRSVDDVVAALVAQLSARELVTRIVKEIGNYKPRDVEAYAILGRLPFSAVVSLNLDHLALEAFHYESFQFSTARDSERLLDALSRNEFFLLWLNGSFDSPSSILLSHQDLKDTVSRNHAFRDLLRRLYYSRSLFFVGVSLNGVENFLRTIDRTAEPSRLHYALVEVTDPAWEPVSRNLESAFGLRMLPFTPEYRANAIKGFLDQMAVTLETSGPPVENSAAAAQITRVELRNIGPFAHCVLDLNERWTVILGDNGVGKSTVLRAIAVGICGKATEPFAERLLKSGTGSGEIRISFGNREYLTTIVRRSGGGVAVEAQSGVPLEREQVLVVGYPALRTVGTQRNSTVSSSPQRPNPGDLIPLTSEEPDPRLDNIKAWIIQIYNLKNSEDTPPPERERYSALYDRVFSLLSTLAAGVVLKPGGVNVKKGEITINTADGPVPFESLSQGTLSLIGWTGALIQRLYETAPPGVDPLQSRAVVLVDEIDAHMHPAWQQALVKRLSDMFVACQFIATSHSPLMVGSLEPDQVYRFERNANGRVEIARPEYALKGLGAAGLLTSGLFGLTSQLDIETADALARKRRLTARRLDPSASKKEREEVDAELKTLEKQVEHIDAAKIVRDPLYPRFVEAMAKVEQRSAEEAQPITLTNEEKKEHAKVAEAIVRDLVNSKDDI